MSAQLNTRRLRGADDELPQRREPPRDAGRRLASFRRPGCDGRRDVEQRVTLNEYEGRTFVSIRVWERGMDGNLYPTQRGVTVRKIELYETIRALCAAAREMGVDLHPKAPPAADVANE